MALPRGSISAPAGETEQLSAGCPLAYTWRYEPNRPELRNLYEKAKREQWNGVEALPWSTPVDPESEILPEANNPLHGSEVWAKMTRAEQLRFRHESLAWLLSNFMHGAQGALLATAQIVDAVPLVDAKFYAATQVMDEARHVEVYERYLREKVQITYPCNPHLKSLLDTILCDGRWDMKYLGMQIVVEGLALAAFRFIHDFTSEPLVKELLRLVMRDEARHVAFGVLSLRDYYARELDERQVRERQEFTYEAAVLMRDRLIGVEVYQKMGLPVEECTELSLRSAGMREFRKFLFMRLVPNVKRLGLLDPWLRQKFAELDVLKFEDFPADA